MITPLVPEAEWAAYLEDLPPWQPPSAPTLIIAPHPDDETLGVGGLIAALVSQRVPVRVAAVTDGENAYPGPGEDPNALAATRRREQADALARLGVSQQNVVRLGLPDGEVASYEAQLLEQLADLVSPGTHIVAPWTADFHPDHEACGRAAAQLAARTRATLTWYFFWTWHRGMPELLADLPLRRFILDPEQLRAKQEALACHRSQLEHASGEPILPDSLLGPVRRPFEVFLPE